MRHVLLDDDVLRTLDVAADVAGMKAGSERYNAVLRRLLKLPDLGASPTLMEAHLDASAGGRIVSIDDMVLDQSLRGTKPLYLYGPDGESEKLTHWSDVVAQIGAWLIQKGHVKNDLPPTSGYRKHPLIGKERNALSHPDVARDLQGGWWIETWGNVNVKGRNLRRLLRAAGMDPSIFKVAVQTD